MTGNASTSKLAHLEEEGELAADYLEESLDIVNLDSDIEIDVENGRASVEIISECSSGLDRLVNENGEILDASQELTHLTVQTETGECPHLVFDIAGFRVERKAELQDLTIEATAHLRITGGAQKLEAMNPFERKVYCGVIAEEGLLSESEGTEPHRCVVILPAEEDEVEETETEGPEKE